MTFLKFFLLIFVRTDNEKIVTLLSPGKKMLLIPAISVFLFNIQKPNAIFA